MSAQIHSCKVSQCFASLPLLFCYTLLCFGYCIDKSESKTGTIRFIINDSMGISFSRIVQTSCVRFVAKMNNICSAC